jgi:hypothetical protein
LYITIAIEYQKKKEGLQGGEGADIRGEGSEDDCSGRIAPKGNVKEES